ncbi:MAG: KOW domain-containing RNA-binding protein [Hydrogenoanaerobacterium sp.]
MLIEKGCVVKSAYGHDADRFYVVMKLEDDFAFICDGKLRRIEKPKRKNQKHLKPTKTVLSVEDLTTNNQIRQALRAYNNPQNV